MADETGMIKAQVALDKRRGGGNAATISTMLQAQRGAIEQALPRHMDADRMVKVAWGCISRSPPLLKCTAQSLVRAVIQAAELGLEPSSSLGHCYLVPYGKDATLIVGYKGLVELAARGGKARFRPARVVYDCDEFTWRDGLEQVLEHTPGKRDASSKPTHAYAVVDFAGGLPAMADVMTYDEVESVRKRSRGANSPAWRDHWDEMAKKTVVRRMSKYVPMSPTLQRAAAEDEERETSGPIEVEFAVSDDAETEGGEA